MTTPLDEVGRDTEEGMPIYGEMPAPMRSDAYRIGSSERCAYRRVVSARLCPEQFRKLANGVLSLAEAAE